MICTHLLALAATVVLDAAALALALGVGRVAVGAAVRGPVVLALLGRATPRLGPRQNYPPKAEIGVRATQVDHLTTLKVVVKISSCDHLT